MNGADTGEASVSGQLTVVRLLPPLFGAADLRQRRVVNLPLRPPEFRLANVSLAQALANPFANDTPGSFRTCSDLGLRWCRRGDFNPKYTRTLGHRAGGSVEIWLISCIGRLPASDGTISGIKQRIARNCSTSVLQLPP